MALPEKIDAVKGVTETFEKTPSVSPMEGGMNEYVDRVPPNKEHFQNLLNTAKPISPIEADTSLVNPSDETQDISKNPIFADENVSAQKSGTATDQEGKKRDRNKQDEEVEAVAATSSSKQAAPSSLMEEVKKLNAHELNLGKISPEDLNNQAKGMIAQLDQVKAKLSEPNTEIKTSYQPLLRNRLTHIDDNLKIALSKLGEEQSAAPVASVSNTSSVNPVERFIGLMSNNQNQIESLMRLVNKLNEQEKIPAGMMLAIQIKVGYVQQQIELFTSLLNKALESTKTIMNVQV